MKTTLISQLTGITDPLAGRNQTREYLQLQVLASLQRVGAMIPLAFHGGTALRFLFGLPRFSEDLDFALEGESSRYDFPKYIKKIKREISTQGFPTTAKINTNRVVHSAVLGFPGLLYELELSTHENETLTIRIEVDTHPPLGAGLATTVLRRGQFLHLQHHDRASLLAGKLHAFLQRPYLKGRDVFDLFWYLSAQDWPPPNLIMLNNALTQTGWSKEHLKVGTWRAAVLQRLESVPWQDTYRDVQPFLEPGPHTEAFSYANFLALLEY